MPPKPQRNHSKASRPALTCRSPAATTRGLITNLAAGIFGSTNAPGSLALSILNAGYLLDVELSAIQEQGRGEVISNPRIVTSNQKESVIRQGQEIGYLTVTGGQSNNVPTVEFKEVLLELKVTPTITNDGRVFMNLAVKKDELEGFVSVGTFGDVPQIAKREVTTAVLVDDGQTVVIGGVYEFRDRSDIATLRSMMTDSMLDEIRTQLTERETHRGDQPNQTDVVMIEAQLLGIEELDDGYMASVEFSGMIREELSAGPSPFREVWNMTKAKAGNSGWLVAGVQALQ